MTKIFVSYRRSDTKDVVGRIIDRLKACFGDECVFYDVSTISPGTDFRTAIEDALNQCKVLLAIIGDDWLEMSDGSGGRRLDDPGDWVRLEISSALRRPSIRVIPVLVEGVTMPSQDALPDDLKPLAARQAPQVRLDPDFDNDMDRLCRAIEDSVPRPRDYIARSALFVTLIVLVFGIGWLAYEMYQKPPFVKAEISFKKFVLEMKKRQEPLNEEKLLQFLDDKAGRRVKWKCVIVEEFDADRRYRIAPTPDMADKLRVYADFSETGGYREEPTAGEKTIIGVLTRGINYTITLEHCEFVD